MTRLTVAMIQADPDVEVEALGPVGGKFGLYIGTWDETPSGCKRPRPLLTSEFIYESSEAAVAAGKEVLKEAREFDLSAEVSR